MQQPTPTVLAVFAHPDDDALSCLGTLAKCAQAHYQVHVLTLTHGENSTTAVDLLRLSEAQRVAQLVGYSLTQQSLPDGRLRFDCEMVSVVEQQIRLLRPQVVITHFPQEHGYGHQDHDVVAYAVVNAARRSKYVNCILYAEPPVQNWGFVPNFFVDITEHIGLKQHAITMHHSESAKAYMLPDIAGLRGRWWALQSHPETYLHECYLEPFVLVKGVFGFASAPLPHTVDESAWPLALGQALDLPAYQTAATHP